MAPLFFNVSQEFDQVWHQGLLYELKYCFPHYFYNIIKSYFCLIDFFKEIKGRTFADGAALLSSHDDPIVASDNLHYSLIPVE